MPQLPLTPAQAAEVAAAPTTVTPDDKPLGLIQARPGPLPAPAIINSPYRTEIDALLLGSRNREEVRRLLREQYGIVVSRASLRNYHRYLLTAGLRNASVVPGSVTLNNIEKGLRKDLEVLDAVVAQYERKLKNGQFTMADILRAINTRMKFLGKHNAMQLLTAEEKYRKALQAVMRAIHDLVDPETKILIQGRLMADVDFVAAMNTASEPIDGEVVSESEEEEDAADV